MERLTFTIDEAAEVLGISRRTLSDALTHHGFADRIGAMQPTGPRGRWIIPRAALHAFLGESA
jgi:excisionase family DNA binding protein